MTTTRRKVSAPRPLSPDRYGCPAVVVATLEIDRYFALTGEVWIATRAGKIDRRYRDCLSCGQVVDDLAAAFPELAPFAAAHLCDVDTGRPMHAIANGLHWLREERPFTPTCTPEECRERAARSFGVLPYWLPQVETVIQDWEHEASHPTFAGESLTDRLSAHLAPTWAATRDAALACFDAFKGEEG